MLYHVTSKENGLKIWNETLKSDSKINNARQQRLQMRKQIDNIAFENYSNYVPRENAIFAWTNFDKASYFAKYYTKPAIVEFEVNQNKWCVDNFYIEVMYEEYNNSTTDEQLYESVVKYFKEYNNQKNDELEVWFQPSKNINIVSVIDSYGEPL